MSVQDMQLVEYPPAMERWLAGKTVVEITENHRSGDLVYRVGEDYILKVSDNIERLQRERAVNDFLTGKIAVSESVLFAVEGERAFYLKTMLKGETLAEEEYLREPQKLVQMLARAMRMIHSVDVKDCPIKSPDSEGNCFIHGDFCLPNILAKDGEISGFIDVEAGGVGDPWMDYAWCIWSLEHNLHTDRYTGLLLEALGIEFDREKFEYYTKDGGQ